MAGRFVTLEGGEGTGKSTQLGLLAAALRGRGLEVVATREPGGAPGAELIRAAILHGAVAWSPLAGTLLHFAARAEHVSVTIRPALDRGAWVLCDRFTDSTRAYQGAGQGIDPAVIAQLDALIGLRPDLTLVLQVPDAVRTQRLANRGERADHYERFPPSFHERVATAFAAIAEAEPDRCVAIDGSGRPDSVHAEILAIVTRRLGIPS